MAKSFSTIGAIIGIAWATKVWRKKGTMDFVTGVKRSTDFEKMDQVPPCYSGRDDFYSLRFPFKINLF